MLFVVPNPAHFLTMAIQSHEQTYRSATTQKDLCQLVSVTSEWCYNGHINSVMFLKLVFQINRYKVKWGSSQSHTMSNSDFRVGLFPPPQCPIPVGATHACLPCSLRLSILWFPLRCPLSYTGPLKGILFRCTILMSFNQPDYNCLDVLTTTLDINTSFTHQS